MNSHSTARYKYRPLRENEIRLLKLSSTNPPIYKLTHVSLRSKPRYVALSYTWGGREQTDRLKLTNGSIGITRNLSEVLSQLRTDHKKSALWIDAICINQDSGEEKSVQIRLMTRIYECADNVYVWLGKPNDPITTKLAIRRLEYVHQKYLRHVKNTGVSPWWLPRKRPTDAAQTKPLFSFLKKLSQSDNIFGIPGTETYRSWLGIFELWESPWWTRTWIYQEATIPESQHIQVTGYFIPINTIVPPHKVDFHCGDYGTTWMQLETAASIAEFFLPSPQVPFSMVSLEAFKRVSRFRSTRYRRQPMDLLELLSMFRNSACNDPRDKVFAPLCLASAEAMEFISPDYTQKSFRDVCFDVVRYCLRDQEDPLSFLGFVDGAANIHSPNLSRTSESWPSWLPNWNDATTSVPLSKRGYIPSQGSEEVSIFRPNRLPEFKGEQFRVYNASGDSKLKARILGQQLQIRVVYCDAVVNFLSNLTPRTIQEARGFAEGLPDVSIVSGETLAVSILRTQVADVRYDRLKRVCGRGNAMDWELVTKEISELSSSENYNRAQLALAFNRANATRKICRTRKGSVGLVPRATEIGDQIFAFLGGQVLYILRKLDDSPSGYNFIGECYIHGLMDGEIWSASPEISDITLI